MEPATAADEAAVARQLGRVPRGLLGVVRRSHCGYPQVILTAPLLVRDSTAGGEGQRPCRVQVFPTQFWLTCPLLVEAISRLEAEGWIARLERRLQADGELCAALARAHEAAAAFRRELIPPEGWRLLDDPQFARQRRAVMTAGVAGIRWRDGKGGGVKCLHAHFADWVGRGDNPIGRWVEERLAAQGHPMACDEECARRCGEDGRSVPLRGH